MADQGRWFKLWLSARRDPDLRNLSLENFARWCLLGCHIKEHGTDGKVKVVGDGRSLCDAIEVTNLSSAIKALLLFPNVTVCDDGGTKLTGVNCDKEISSPISIAWRNWHKYQVDSSAERTAKWRGRVTTKKRRELNPIVEKPAKGKDPCKICVAILAHLNQRTGKKLQLVGDGSRYMHVRHTQYGQEACIKVIDYKVREWGRDEKLRLYLDHVTLFRPTNFDRYLNQIGTLPGVVPPRRYPEGDVE